MPFTSNDVAAFAEREHAHRTRLLGLVTIVLALALFILPTFESPISSIAGNSRLLGPLDLCRRDRDDCPTDRSKTKPGLCGCGVPDTDTDGDGTPDCNDGCPRDVSKTSPGACGCGITDTYNDTDGDGTLDCSDDCIDNDPSILSFCESNREYNCEGCAGKFIRLWKDCGLMCLSEIDYCLDNSEGALFVYNESLQDYEFQSYYTKLIQTGADSSNSVIEESADRDDGEAYDFLNGVPCSFIDNGTVECLVCDDGNEYCIEDGVPPLSSNPMFGIRDKVAVSLWETCSASDKPTTSEFEMKPIGSKLSPYAPALFNHGT